MVEDELEKIIDESFVSSYSTVAGTLIGSIKTSVIISIIGSAGYGLYNTIVSNISIATIVYNGINSGINRTIPREDRVNRNTIGLISFALFIILLIISVGVILYFGDLVKENLFKSEASNKLLYVTILYLSISVIYNFFKTILKSYEKVSEWNYLSRWIAPILLIITLIVSSMFIDFSITILFVVLTIWLVFMIFLSLIFIRVYTDFNLFDVKYDEDLIKDFLNYVLGASGSTLLGGAQSNAKKFMLIFITPVQAGAFGVQSVITGFVNISLRSVNDIYPQVATRLYENEEYEK